MRRAHAFGLMVLLAGCGTGSRTAPPAATPSPASGWILSWSDEFDGPAGATVDATKWTFDVGGGGFGNQELESYTDRPRNAHLSGEGALVIDVLREDHTGPDGIAREFTSARLKTQGLFAQTYGRFEARIKVPSARASGPRSGCSGADIDERRLAHLRRDRHHGEHRTRARDRARHDSRSGLLGRRAAIGAPFTLARGQRFADDFHVFAVEWEREALRFYVDGQLYPTRTPDEPARGQPLGLRPSVLPAAERRGGRQLARPSGRDHRLPPADARGLRAGL